MDLVRFDEPRGDSHDAGFRRIPSPRIRVNLGGVPRPGVTNAARMPRPSTRSASRGNRRRRRRSATGFEVFQVRNSDRDDFRILNGEDSDRRQEGKKDDRLNDSHGDTAR